MDAAQTGNWSVLSGVNFVSENSAQWSVGSVGKDNSTAQQGKEGLVKGWWNLMEEG